jgi:hypothetical protein
MAYQLFNWRLCTKRVLFDKIVLLQQFQKSSQCLAVTLPALPISSPAAQIALRALVSDLVEGILLALSHTLKSAMRRKCLRLLSSG